MVFEGGTKCLCARDEPQADPVPRTLSSYFDRVDHAYLDVVDRVGDPRRVLETLSFAAYSILDNILKINRIDTNKASKGEWLHNGLLNIIQEGISAA